MIFAEWKVIDNILIILKSYEKPMLAKPSEQPSTQKRPFFVFSILGHSSKQIEDRVEELSHLRHLPCFQELVQASLTDSSFQREH